jgi:SAM-dependent methyltransferase
VHVETAVWTREALAGLPLVGDRALDVGSSTLDYRTHEQPHIETEVWAPVRARGVEVVHLDAKSAPGVDVVLDLNAPDDPPPLGEFALVVVASVLQYLREPARVARLAASVLPPGGWLVAQHPESARRSYDPLDNGLRMTPPELATLLERAGFERVRAESVRIDDPRYYRGLVSRPSWTPVRSGRWWIPLPGVTDQARLRIPRLRWRQSCVLMRRASP